VFLFAAIVMVIFVPSVPAKKASRIPEMTRLFTSVHDTLLSMDSGPTSVHTGLISRPALDRLFEGDPLISSFAIVRIDSSMTTVFEWTADHITRPIGFDGPSEDSAAIASILQLVAGMPHGFQLNLTEQRLKPLHLQRFDMPNIGPVIFAAEEISDLIVSSRSYLIRTIGLLFLCSTLVSLLIVYLLGKRLQEPLDRLAQKIEESAIRHGENGLREFAVDEEEISRLAAGFNKLSDTSRRNHTAACESDKKLHLADSALRESQQFMHTIIESSPSALIVTDAENKIVLINAAATREFNCPASKAVGQYITSLFALPNGSVLAAQGQSGFETVCWKRNAEAFPAYIVTAPVETDDGDIKARLYIIRDIVESRGYQDMMVRLDRNSTRGAMAADIGHEINNFLAVVLGNLELLPRSIAKGDEPGIKKKLDTMKSNVEKIARFADGLMVESPNEDVVCVSASVNQIVENVIAFLRYQNRFDGVDWVVQLHPDLPMAELDDARIQQVLVNLLYNAAEAVGDIEGNQVITIATRSDVRGGVPVVHVDVIDNGPGVQKDRESLLFKTRFTTKKKGHGFGLMTCQRIVDQHSGRIGYAYENGAHFWFELPLVHVVPDGSPVTAMAGAAV
jgi:PAS domain S-box-containing protein